MSGSASRSWRASVRPARPAPSDEDVDFTNALLFHHEPPGAPSTTAQAWPSAAEGGQQGPPDAATWRVAAEAPVRGNPSSVRSRPRMPGRAPSSKVPSRATAWKPPEAPSASPSIDLTAVTGRLRGAPASSLGDGRPPRPRSPVDAAVGGGAQGVDLLRAESRRPPGRSRTARARRPRRPASVPAGSKAEPWPSTSARTRAPRAARRPPLPPAPAGRPPRPGRSRPGGRRRGPGASRAEAAPAPVVAEEGLEAELLGAAGEQRRGAAAADLARRRRRWRASPEASPAEIVELTPAQAVPDGRLPGRGVDHAVGEVERAGVGGAELQAAAVELGDRAGRCRRWCRGPGRPPAPARSSGVQPLSSSARWAAASSSREVRSIGRRLRSPR